MKTLKSSSANDFCVYRHIRLDTNTPFYVGKGSLARAYKIKSNRSEYHKRIRLKHGCVVQIIFKNLTEAEAFAKEIEFIALYKKFGMCEANLTLGGEGSAGRLVSKETAQKIAKANLGKKAWNKGLKCPDISARQLGKKRASAWNKGKKGIYSKDALERMSNAASKKTGELNPFFGKQHSEETKRALSNARKGKKLSEAHKIAIASGLKKRYS